MNQDLRYSIAALLITLAFLAMGCAPGSSPSTSNDSGRPFSGTYVSASGTTVVNLKSVGVDVTHNGCKVTFFNWEYDDTLTGEPVVFLYNRTSSTACGIEFRTMGPYEIFQFSTRYAGQGQRLHCVLGKIGQNTTKEEFCKVAQ